MFGLQVRKEAKQRVSGYQDHRSFYSDSLIEVVATTWAREIELFGFDFDLSDIRQNRTAVLRRLAKSSYVWRQDKLTTRSLKSAIGTIFNRNASSNMTGSSKTKDE